jgi:hypothetical protein
MIYIKKINLNEDKYTTPKTREMRKDGIPARLFLGTSSEYVVEIRTITISF